MANQPTPATAQPPPDLPNMPDVSTTLSGYLRTFSLWCRNGFAAKVDINVAQVGLLLMGYDAPAGAAPNVYQFEVNNAGVAGLAPVPLTGAPGAFTPIGGVGVIDGSNAAPGQVGEVISSNVTTAVPLTTATTANVTSIALTAGDWDVCGEVWFVIGAGGATAANAAINTVSATMPAASAIGTARSGLVAALSTSGATVLSLRPSRVSLSAPTTYYLSANLVFPSGTCTATGNIIARRAR